MKTRFLTEARKWNTTPSFKNIELATKITNKDSDMLSFLDSFEFVGTLEFDIDPNLIRTKNWEGITSQPSRT